MSEWMKMCVSVCVCVRERVRMSERSNMCMSLWLSEKDMKTRIEKMNTIRIKEQRNRKDTFVEDKNDTNEQMDIKFMNGVED